MASGRSNRRQMGFASFPTAALKSAAVANSLSKVINTLLNLVASGGTRGRPNRLTWSRFETSCYVASFVRTIVSGALCCSVASARRRQAPTDRTTTSPPYR